LEKALLKTETLARKEPVGVLAKVGIEGALQMNSKEDIQAKLDEVLMEESSRIEKRIGYLAMLANVATLLGLLGTIAGLIQSFAGISQANPAQKAELLSTGISLAMNTTAYGLLVAIPALISYSIYQSRASQLIEDLNKGAMKLYIGLTTYNSTSKRV
jgi:biopolymer transport protein ExbB/TolQ